jgi:adenylate kinase
MIITITGTPGVGKTFIAKKLAGRNFEYFDLNKHIKEQKIFDDYDKKDKTYDVDVKKLKKINNLFEKNLGIKHKMTINSIKDRQRYNDNKIKLNDLRKILSKEEGIIIDSHLSHYLKSDLCMVVKSDIKKIRERLEKRNYSKKKIEDNVQSEIFDICLEEARKEKNNMLLLEN